MKRRKRAKTSYICFWVHCLAEDAPKSGKNRFTKFGHLTARHPMERAKIV